MNTILFGNGFNLLNGTTSWDKLVHGINDSNDKAIIPNTLQYEAKIMQLPDKKPESFSKDSELSLKNDIAAEMSEYKSNDAYLNLASLDSVDHYITTNYDNVMEDTLKSIGYTTKDWVRRESTYSLRRKIVMANKGREKYLWHCHGEIVSPKTIMLGLDQYCGSVGRISEFLSGTYKFKEGKDDVTVPRMSDRLDGEFGPTYSWIDLFFKSNVYIVGFSLLYEEIDIWWVLARRMRLVKQGKKVDNRIMFFGKVDKGKKELFNSIGVDVYEPKTNPVPNNYELFYQEIIDVIKEMTK